MELLENCLFINLDKRVDRLEHVTKQLEMMGINGERFKAVETKDGAIGCTMSHIKCLELAKARGYEQVFICEDDIEFTNKEVFLKSLDKFYTEGPVWDVCILGGNNGPPYSVYSDYCVRVFNCQTTTGYIVKKHYYDVLIDNFRESVRNLIREPENKKMYALDVYWKRLQQQNLWYFIVPITIAQVESYSDIENRVTDYRWLMMDLEKKWLLQQMKK
jgi:GR25 family glycosyltransferase involved in LPS biosynthesis